MSETSNSDMQQIEENNVDANGRALQMQAAGSNPDSAGAIQAQAVNAVAVAVAAPQSAGVPKPAVPAAPVAPTPAYDASSYDPLQTSAFQLSASAGLSNHYPIYAPSPVAVASPEASTATTMMTTTTTTAVATTPADASVQQAAVPHASVVQHVTYQIQAPAAAVAMPIPATAPTPTPAMPPSAMSGPAMPLPPAPAPAPTILVDGNYPSVPPPASQPSTAPPPPPVQVPAPPPPPPPSLSSSVTYHQHAPTSVTVIPQQVQVAPIAPPGYTYVHPQQQIQQPSAAVATAPLPIVQAHPSSTGVTSAALPPVQQTMPQQYYATATVPVAVQQQPVAPAAYSSQIQPSSQQSSHVVPIYGKRSGSSDLAGAPPPKKQNTTVDESEIDPIHRKPPPNFATMSAEEKRRFERNVREQQRSFKISQQIKELKNVLHESNIPFKPNKFSILLSVVEYIKQLQTRAIMIDAEHRKLIDTIRQTNEMVNSGQAPVEDEAKGKLGTNVGNESGMLFVQGLDYKAVFKQCNAALSVAALDGRILDCNHEFATVSGFSHEALMRQSVFNLMQNHEDVFKAMGQMLSNSDKPAVGEDAQDGSCTQMYWSGTVNQKDQSLQMNITLTQSPDGRPKFFNCALTATS